MNKIETLKAQAKNLKIAMASMGVQISHAQALEAIAQQYGVENWDTLAGLVKKADTVALSIPEVVKSAKGCQLLILPSHDGARWDRHMIVPPHLDAEVISAKMACEILRLKAIDDVLDAAGEAYDGYTDADLAKFAGSLGCLWVAKPVVVSENWD